MFLEIFTQHLMSTMPGVDKTNKQNHLVPFHSLSHGSKLLKNALKQRDPYYYREQVPLPEFWGINVMVSCC